MTKPLRTSTWETNKEGYPCTYSSSVTRLNTFHFSVTLEASSASSSKKKRKVKSMLPLSAVADNKSKAATQEECVELAKIIYGEVILKHLSPSEWDVVRYLCHVLNSQRS